MTMKVIVGWWIDGACIAQAEQRSMWSVGKTPEEAIENFKKEYGALPIEYEFIIKEEHSS